MTDKKKIHLSRDVVVIGGGVVGLSAALAMHQRGFTVALVDAGSLTVARTAVSPRVYAINTASQRLLERLQVWDKLEVARVSPYQHMHVWDAAVPGAQIDFDARMIATNRLGCIIDESNLRQGLLQAITQQQVTVCPESTVTAVKECPEGVEVYAGSTILSAKLLIIADGASSPTREQLGVSMYSWPYHQHALVATVQTEHAHQETAYQVFNTDGVLAFLPLAHPNQCSIVWSGAPQLTQHRLALSADAFNQQLTGAFEAKLGEVSVLSQRHTFPLHMRHVKHYVGAHWLLMGDAAHTIHPLAGLGLNLGLADLTAWLHLLDDERHSIHAKKTLGAYQRQRKHAVWQAIALMEGLKVTFLNPFPPIAALRGFGLNLCNRLTPLKRRFIEHATGG